MIDFNNNEIVFQALNMVLAVTAKQCVYVVAGFVLMLFVVWAMTRKVK